MKQQDNLWKGVQIGLLINDRRRDVFSPGKLIITRTPVSVDS